MLRITVVRIIVAASGLAGAAILAHAQGVVTGSGPSGRPILINGDVAVLEAGDVRKDLNCTVTPQKALLGLDLKFHSGYTVSIPLHELEGAGNRLAVLFRVISKTKTEPIYFNQHVRVPPLEGGSGEVMLNGFFDLGEGDYHVDWLMRDFAGRYCSFYWDVTAALAPHDKQVAPSVPLGWIAETEDEKFQAEPPSERREDPPLNVKVLMNFAPERPDSAAVSPQDRLGLVSILRNLARNPRIGKISLVTFNLEQERVLYRQSFENQIDFPALGHALKALNLGTVDAHHLENKYSGAEFLSSLTRNEMAADRDVDGLIFVGPKSLLTANIPDDQLKAMGEPLYPLFYMNYSPDPVAVPWRDAIGKMVKFFRGREFTISGPRDLWNAVSEAVDRMTKFKQTRSAGGISGGSDSF